ncbi:MAG: signal peptide peptidase SppA [Planctomycetaceae bacterium]
MQRSSSRFSVSLFSAALVCVCLTSPLSADSHKPVVAKKPTPRRVTWAEITLQGSYPEGVQAVSLFGSLKESLSEGIARIDRAADNKRISGIILHIKNPTLGRAKQNEFRQAIQRARDKGKRVIAHMDSATTSDLIVASACDEVVMSEPGVLLLIGLRAEITFYKNLFDKLAIKPQMLRVGEFKSAAEPYSRTTMSEPFRREMNEILDDFYRQMVDTLASSRKLKREQVLAAIDSGPHTAVAAKKLGLIDRIAYADELPAIIRGRDNVSVYVLKAYGKKKVDNDFSGITGMMKMMNMLMGVQPTRRSSSSPKIAVIHATGAINTGKSTSSLLGGEVMGSDTIVKAIQRAAKDKTVKAIVLRVDSPGGSALASDLMWRALHKAGKPVVASMGDVAASGGYYISMGADCIFAEPGTLTGSIGVVGGKLALRGLYKKVGINTTVLSRGKNAGALSMTDEFSKSERAAMQKMMNTIYKQFVTKAAQGRKMPYDKLEKLARGRVYSGKKAWKIGLVDKLGTLRDAIAHAKTLGGFKPGERVEILRLPRPTSPFDALLGTSTGARSKAATASALQETLNSVSPELSNQLRGLDVINLLSQQPVLTLMPFRLTIK